MTLSMAWALYLPVLAWGGAGIGLFLALRQGTPALVLRLAATFLALWSLLATTALVWVLANGGAGALSEVAQRPLSVLAVFAPSAWPLWAEGAIAVFGIFAAVFLLNQSVGRGMLRLLDPSEMPWPGRLPRPRPATSLYVVRGDAREAFSFTLLEARPPGFRPHRREVIVLSEGLLDCLTPPEVEAVIAHELGHIHDLDGRYLTFLRTLARLVRWDPFFAVLARVLTRREEIHADDDAVRLTGRPLPLARAIYKASLEGATVPLFAPAAGLLGRRWGGGRQEAVERIHRLVAMAEGGPDLEGPSA
jgi:Zn-dependent protease with chaperone function